MTDDRIDALHDKLDVIVDALSAIAESQHEQAAAIAGITAALDTQAHSLQLIALASATAYYASGAAEPLPHEALEDPAFELFLRLHPDAGAPILGQADMDGHLERLDRVDKATLAAGFRELREKEELSLLEKARNRQVEYRVRQKHGDLERLEREGRDDRVR